MVRRIALALPLCLAACALASTAPTGPHAEPREIRFYTADNPTELSQIVNGSAAQGCRFIQVVPHNAAFIAVVDCPRGSHAAPQCGKGEKCPTGA